MNRTVNRFDVAALVAMIVAAMILLTLTASTATAQIKLGKVKTAVTKAVIPAAVSPSSGGGIKTGTITFDDRVLEITAERLDQFMLGLAAEEEMSAKMNAQDLDAIDRANAAAEAAYRKELAAWDAKKAQHEKCTGAITNDLERQLKPDMPAEQDQKKMEAIAVRIKAAKEAGNLTEVRRISDSLVAALSPANTRMVNASNNAVTRASTECGTLAPRPESPNRQNPITWSDVTAAGAKASRMGSEQYAIFRERVAPFVISNGASSDMMYTSSEVDAMKSKSDALGKWGMALKNN
jgi:hypothetical protein